MTAYNVVAISNKEVQLRRVLNFRTMDFLKRLMKVDYVQSSEQVP
jgi:hypothetical protein